MGPAKYLEDTEEQELVQFLLRGSNIGYAKTWKQVIALIQRINESRRIYRTVSDGWWTSFTKRHPNLTLRIAAPLSHARATSTDPEIFENYFDLLQKTLDNYSLRNQPCLIFNMDKTGVPLNPKPPKGIYSCKNRNPVALSSGDKSQITVVGCVNAGGFCMPPMVIWDRKTLAPALTEGEVPGTIYGLSERGWMDSGLFDIWFHNHFLRYVPVARPILLLLDGHSSHYCPETILKAAKEDIILFALPSHTSHLSQPLDKGCFGPLKCMWREVCYQYLVDNPSKVITRYTFSKLFSEAWMKSITIGNIMAGFATTGIYPLNRDAILSRCTTAIPSSSLESNLTFIPMYSPMPARRHHQSPKISFTDEELFTFNKWFEEGYDLICDDRYNQWLRIEHPEEASILLNVPFTPDSSPYVQSESHPTKSLDQVCMPSGEPKTLEKFFTYPEPPTKKILTPKPCGRVLTSVENMKILHEIQRKQRAKEEREEKKKAKAEAAKELHKLREEKRITKQKEKEQKEKGRRIKSIAGKVYSEVVNYLDRPRG